ncbi:hypothetical protein IEQ34_012653 [Dendrobium chrysotoxum]|uniref:Bulb-type lectin domain-containing protein n=1 Tax=Dendrobium chrysotoxum TaxID=161865 RepID=A0AAV7GP81_DENCH|nr:hypothetical protein IEQ34_012653 [Dendrobium chrysotoxum]
MAAIGIAFRSSFLMVMVIISIGLLAIGGTAENHLLAGDKLKTGENISDANYSLRMQEDCNLVLYRLPDKVVWLTYTQGKGTGCELTMQNDGNLLIHDDKQKVVWETQTNGTVGNYALVLQRDRDLAIYSSPLWSSGTAA